MGDCLRSVAEQLGEVSGGGEKWAGRPRALMIEHFVLDGGSTDDSAEVAARYAHVTWIQEPADKNMRRSKTITIAEAMQDFIREMNLGDKLKEVGVVESWESLVGKAIASRTSKVYIKDGILFVHLKSSIVKNELLMIREALREKLNEKAGGEIVKEIVFR